MSKAPETTVFQKVVILFAFATAVALVSLTASLPLNLPSHQPSMGVDAPATSAIDNGDTAWMIVAALLASLVGPAAAYFYSNLYGRTSTGLVQAVLVMASMITLIWIVFTFSLVFGKDSHGTKILGYPKEYYMFSHAGNLPTEPYASTIPASIFAIFELSFAILTPTIVLSALFERVNFFGFLFFTFVWHIIVFSPVAHIVWNENGFFKTNDIEDFSGGIVVNILAGVTVVAGHIFLNFIQAPKADPAAPKDSPKILLSGLVMWFFWFGVNAGKAHNASAVAAQSIVNTIGAVAVSVLFNYLIDLLFDISVTEISIANAIALGLICSTPSSGLVTVGGAMVITVITSMATRLVCQWLLKDGLDNQPYSISTLHGFAGSISFIFTAMLSYRFVNENGINGLTFGNEGAIRHHTAAVLAMWACGLPSVLVLFFLSNLFVPLSKAAQKSDNIFAPVNFGPFTGPSEETAAAEPQPVPVEEPKEKIEEPISTGNIELNA